MAKYCLGSRARRNTSIWRCTYGTAKRVGSGSGGKAMMESFWSRMQVELLDRKSWRTRVELANAIFEYLEIFHNRQRRHSALGMLTPIEFEDRQLHVVA